MGVEDCDLECGVTYFEAALQTMGRTSRLLYITPAEASTDLERHGALSANHIVDSPGPNLTIVPELKIKLLI